jgi:chromate transporter
MNLHRSGILIWLLRVPPKWPSKGSLNGIAIFQVPFSATTTTLDVPLPMQIGVFFAKAGAFVDGVKDAAIEAIMVRSSSLP